MKKFIHYIFLLLLLGFFNNCKKGEGDPTISLKSRKARLEGSWNIDNYTKNFNISGSTNVTNSETYQGTTMTQMYNSSYSSAGTETVNDNLITIVSTETNQYTDFSTGSPYNEKRTKNGTGNAVATIEFSKDGTFSRTIEYTGLNFVINVEYTGVGLTFSQVINSTERRVEKTNGTWEFMGKVDNEYKNKERILLKLGTSIIENSYSDNLGVTNSRTESFTYAAAANSEIWTLTTLGKNVLEYEGEYKLQSNYSSNNATVNNNSSESDTRNGSTLNGGTISASLSK